MPPTLWLAYHHNNNVKVAKWQTMRKMHKIYSQLARAMAKQICICYCICICIIGPRFLFFCEFHASAVARIAGQKWNPKNQTRSQCLPHAVAGADSLVLASGSADQLLDIMGILNGWMVVLTLYGIHNLFLNNSFNKSTTIWMQYIKNFYNFQSISRLTCQKCIYFVHIIPLASGFRN